MPSPKMQEISATLLARYPGLMAVETWGETALFLNPGDCLPRGVYFATLKGHDGENDQASKLDRPGVFRLSFVLRRSDYLARFGPTPPRPTKGGVTEGEWDFSRLDTLIPHPVYAWMGWVAILNPSCSRLEALFPLLDASFEKSQGSLSRRLSRVGRRLDA
jgi:hypothetical protein